MECVMIDATIVKVHRHGQGAKGDAKPSHRPLERRNDYQHPGTPKKYQSFPNQSHSPAEETCGGLGNIACCAATHATMALFRH
jgi:hypothetical protein